MKKQIEQLSYRSIPTLEENGGKRILRGKLPFNSKSDWLGGYYEVIAPTAFRKTLMEQDVKILMDHDSSKVLGRRANNTARFAEEADGLVVEVELPDTTYANDVWNLIQRGDVDTMSFGFTPIKTRDDGNTRILDEVKLYEVSFAVPFPAYGGTQSVALTRTWFDKRNIDVDEINEVLEKATELTVDEIAKIKKLVGELETKIQPPSTPEVVVAEVPIEPSKPDTQQVDSLLLEMEIEASI